MTTGVDNREQLTQDVIRILREKIAIVDTGFRGSINESTRLVGDLGFESVTIVEFCMAIGKHFRRKLPFQGLVFRDRIFQDFTVGDMVTFLESRLTRPDAGQRASTS